VHMFGLLQVVVASIEMVKGILEVRANEALTRYFIEAKIKNDSGRMWAIIRLGYLIDLAIAIVGFLFFQVSASYIADLYGESVEYPLGNWLRLYAFYFLAGMGGNSMWGILQSYEKFNALARIQFYLEFGRVVFPLLFYLLWGGLESILIGFVVAIALNNYVGQILTWIFIKKTIPQSNEGHVKEEFKLMWPFFKQSFFSLCLKSVNRQAVLPMVQMLTNNSVITAVVSIAIKLASLLSLTTSAVSSVFFTRFTELWVKRKYKEFRALILKATRIIFVASFLFAILIYFTFPLFLRLLGKEGEADFAALPDLLMVYLAVNVVVCAASWARPACLAMSRPQYSTYANLLIAVIFLSAAPLLLPTFGLAGMAVTYMVMWLLPMLLYSVWIWVVLGRFEKVHE